MAPSEKLIAKLTAAAESGDPSAQLRLGILYMSGNGVPLDSEKGIQYLTQSAEQGDADAQTELGMCYREGDGVERDLPTAVSWFQKAAEKGQTEAQNSLGLAYEAGEGVEKDMTECVKWFRLAADQGHAEAQCNIGVIFHMVQEYNTAFEYFTKSSDQKDPGGQYNLGLMYKYGRGITQDKVKGNELLSLSAEQGYELAIDEIKKGAAEDAVVE